MNKFGSINYNAAANAVKKDCSYIMIEPIVPPSRRSENQHINKRHFNDDSRSKSTRNEFEAEQSIRRKRRDDKLADQIVERLETKMDQKMRNLETEINLKTEQLNGQVSKLTESVEIILNYVVIHQSKRDRSRSHSNSRSSKRRRVSSSKSISRSRSRSQKREKDHHHHYRNQGERSRSQKIDREQPATAASNIINNEMLAHLRQKYTTPALFARNLMPILFTMDEMTVKNVNVEGRSMKGVKEPAIGLSPRRVAELKRHCLKNVALHRRESVWRECRIACNHKLKQFKEKKRENQNASRSRKREQNHRHNNGEREREQIAAESSNLIDNETIESLRKLHSTPTTFATNLMLKLFTLDEMTVENVNVEGRMIGSSQVHAVGLSPRRVAELKRHCLQNVPLNERQSTWRDCRHACNQKMLRLKKINANK